MSGTRHATEEDTMHNIGRTLMEYLQEMQTFETGLLGSTAGAAAEGLGRLAGRGRAGRWIRRGNRIVLFGGEPDPAPPPGALTTGTNGGADFIETEVRPQAAGINRCVKAGCIKIGDCNVCERRIPWSRPKELVPVPKNLCRGRVQQLDRKALEAYQRLYAAASSELNLGEHLKLVFGHRDYSTDAQAWRTALLAVMNMLGCRESALPCLAQAIDATDAMFKTAAGPLECNAWDSRFKAELKKRGCTVECDPAKVGWLAKKYEMPATDPINVALRHKHHALAPATSSPHGTGRALDLYLGGPLSTAENNVRKPRATPAYRWMTCHAARFGFYPYNVEPWHWEYNPA